MRSSLISFLVFIVSMSLIVYSLATKSMPLWLYVILPIVTSIAIISIFDKGHTEFALLSSLILALLLWNFHSIATHYNLFPFYDGYKELTHLRMVLSEGRINIGATYPEFEAVIGPGFSTSYPLYVALTSQFTLITGLKPIKTAVVFPSVTGLFALLSTLLLVRRLLANAKVKSLALPLAIVAFAISPDMGYVSTHFYHRELSLGFCFLLTYLLAKYFLNELKFASTLILVLTILILPLTHSVYPNIFTIFAIAFSTLTALAFMLTKRTGLAITADARIKPVLLYAFILFSMGFVWNFIVNYPSPVSLALGGYIDSLLRSRYEIGDIRRFILEAEPVLPKALRPEPWPSLLPMRDVLIIAPMLIVGALLLLKIMLRKPLDKTDLVVIITMASFTPIVASDYIAGWYPLRFRYYAFPLISYSFGLFYASLINSKKVLSVITFVILAFLISIAFLSPYWHIYYPRQLYDPSIGWKEVGYPNPEYVKLSEFFKEHPIEDGVILSDSKYLASVVLPLNKLKQIRDLCAYYGETSTYVIEFLDFHIPLGYGSPEAVQRLAEIKGSIGLEYFKVLDSTPYAIYYKP